MEPKTRGEDVIITHAINPHMFWYKLDDQPIEDAEILSKIEKLIFEHVKKTKNNEKPVFRVGDFVAVHYVECNKWIRAEIDFIDAETGRDILVWAIDYGKPMYVAAKRIVPLDSSLKADKPVGIFWGGLHNCVPAKWQIASSSKLTFARSMNWSPKAVDTFKNIIQQTEFKFEIVHSAGDHHFGDLTFSKGRDTIDIKSILKDLEEAIISTSNFDNDLNELDTIKIKRCQTNDMNIHMNPNKRINPRDETNFEPRVLEANKTRNEVDKTDMMAAPTTSKNNDEYRPKPSSIIGGYESNNRTTVENPPQSRRITSSTQEASSKLKEGPSFTTARVANNKYKRERRIFMFGTAPISPIFNLADADFFSENIQAHLSKSPDVLETYAYAWPHLMRNNSLILIDAIAKANAYLPAVCMLVLPTSSDSLLAGPKAIICCSEKDSVERISQRCKLYMDLEDDCNEVVEVTEITNKDKLMTRIDSCLILVIALPALVKISPLIEEKNIAHIVIDEMDKCDDADQLEDIINTYIKEGNNLQVILTSSTYDDVMTGLQRNRRINNNPLFLIGGQALTEAAIFSKIAFDIKLLTENISDIRKWIQKLQGPTIMLCNNGQDVDRICAILGCLSVQHYQCSANPSDGEKAGITQWKAKQSDNSLRLLICTAATAWELRICQAQNVIHFSLPPTMVEFSKRFLVILKPMEEYRKKKSSVKPHCIIFIDKKPPKLWPRVLKFLHEADLIDSSYNIEEDVHVQHLETDEVNPSSHVKRPLCFRMIEFGKACDNKFEVCRYRHQLEPTDQPRNRANAEYSIKINTCIVRNPNKLWVLCNERRGNESHTWNQKSDFSIFEAKFIQHYSLINSLPKFWKGIQIGYLGVIFTEDTPYRVKVIGIDKDMVQVHLIDYGHIKDHPMREVYYLTEEYQKVPPRCKELYITGIIPKSRSGVWKPDALKYVKAMVYEHLNGDADRYIEATVIFELKDTLLVKDVVLVKPVQGDDRHRSHISIKDEMIRRNFGRLNSDGIDYLIKSGGEIERRPRSRGASQTPEYLGAGRSSAMRPSVSADFNVESNNRNEVSEPLKEMIEKQPTEDQTSSVVSRDDQNSIRAPKFLKHIKSICLTKTQSKVEPLKIEKATPNTSQALSFNDRPEQTKIKDSQKQKSTQSETQKEKDTPKPTVSDSDDSQNPSKATPSGSNERLSRAPESENMQSSSPTITPNQLSRRNLSSRGTASSVSSIEEIRTPRRPILTPSISTTSEVSDFECTPRKRNNKKDTYVELNFERVQKIKVTHFCSPSKFYVQNLSKIATSTIDKLYKEIEEYVQAHEVDDIDVPDAGNLCLVKFRDGRYYRGEIQKIQFDAENIKVDVICRDRGVSERFSSEDILQLPKYLRDCLPFQAIPCSLVGIKPFNSDDWDKDLCEKIYNDIIGNRADLLAKAAKVKPSPEFSCYNIVLIDGMSGNINNLLVEKKYASYNEETKEHINIIVDDSISESSELEHETSSNVSSNENDWQHVDERSYTPMSSPLPSDYEEVDFDGLEINFTDDQLKEFMQSSKRDDTESDGKAIQSKEDFRKEPIEEASAPLKPVPKPAFLPRLTYRYKVPKVEWYQTTEMIVLTIAAFDSVKYCLNVTADYLLLRYINDDEQYQVLLPFFGSIRTDCVFHENRGLNILIKIGKSFSFYPWPRLLSHTDNDRWLIPQYDSLSINDRRFIGQESRRPKSIDDDDYESEEDSVVQYMD